MKVAGLFWLLPALVAAQSSTVTLSPWQTGEVTPDGTCGKGTGFVCSPTWGACCSGDGICGRSSKYCGEGCQPSAGNCNAAAPPPEAPPGPGSVSPDGSCGGTNKFICGGSPFGDCCSEQGWCGNSTAHCGNNCLPDFGTCGPPSNITFDGQCGANGKICLDSGYGDCCSGSGWCGDKTDHCGAGCQNGFGTCTGGDSGNVSTDGSCGKNGKTCKGSAFGDCCSAEGYCGKTDDFCTAGCQSNFGTCAAETDISTDGFCGKNGKVCKGSKYGDCCSAEGYCGKDSHCGAGCQPKFGTCAAETNISTDGFCGKNGKVCKGSTYGDCCSAQGYCGKETGHCDAGCQSAFGSCNSAAGNISTDGQCGKNGKTCKGSTFGDCCSPQGWCGKEKDHCGTGCQSGFGTCDASAGNVSTDGSCGKNGKICKGSQWGDCCSKNGYCGKGDDYCRDGCQTAYGLCTGISTDAECGSRNGKTCVGSGLGNCCSANGFCGSTSTHCGQGCQKGSSSACLTKDIPTLDGSCGSKVGLTCAGGPFNGQCCSVAGYCGTSTHCGSGCQRGFGRCN
ncbi:Lectin-B [Fusarium oxysporum f. sp. cubense]|uniref:Lectin-B n=1 Tax=Fusarium oxysporum f. sp. cubense TaxID=61366 RepID=A0A559L620_FUSOC|nr:Lectin-B [Fusarium oxysporum f. sp. cubense]